MVRHPTCECGYAYVPGARDGERIHRERHAAYSQGPLIPALRSLRSVASIDARGVCKVDRTTPEEIRRAVAEVAYVARRETPEYKVGFDGTLSDEDPRLYVVGHQLHAVGMAMVTTTTRAWRLRWVSATKACLRSREAATEPRPLLARLWIAGSHRRQGIASRLVAIVAGDTGVKASEISWQLPFSPAGLTFVRRVAPGDWYGDCDQFDLEDLLTDPAVCEGSGA